VCPRNLVRSLSADLDGFLRGLALWFNEEIETGRWGNGAEEAPHPPDSENLLLSEIMKDDSKRGRVELKGSVRHAHLDVNGMDIDVEPEDLTTNGDLHEVIVDGAPKPLDPIMEVMGILLRVEVALKETDQTTSTVLEKRIVEDALRCNLHKIGGSLVEKVVDACLHPEQPSQTIQDRM
jgi:hypothetical protein